MFGPVGRLNELGILGVGRRNAEYVLRHNPRKLYPLADDKLRTKAMALEAGIAVPELYGTIRTQQEIRGLTRLLEPHQDFVVKPAGGTGGNGILVVERVGGCLRSASGAVIDPDDLRHHVSNILSGQYSLGGVIDKAMIEYRVRFDPLFEAVTFQGVPDVRIIVFLGYPAMAMVRLPTRQSGGKANLHQGAIGAGVDMASGETLTGVSGTRLVTHHPDTLNPIAGISIPGWDDILGLAASIYELTGLGYVGVDIVLDRTRGPLILELNVRPGLNIQIANAAGLRTRLEAIDATAAASPSVGERVTFAQSRFGARQHAA